MTDRELMQMALDALLRVWHSERNIKHSEAIDALRARLAQPEPEPVAQVDYNERGNIQWLFGKQIPDKTFLYTTPPQREWQGLTEDEVQQLFGVGKVDATFMEFTRAIEAKLKEKNT